MPYRGGGSSAAELPAGLILVWSGSLSTIPAGWSVCNGGGGTPDLRNRFVQGANTTPGGTGGGSYHTHTVYGTALPSGGDPPEAMMAEGEGGGQTLGLLEEPGEPGEHTHEVEGSTYSSSHVPSYHQLFFIRKD